MKQIPILIAALLLLCSCGASPKIKTSQLEGNQTEARISAFSDDGSLIAVGYGKRISPTPGRPNFVDANVKIYSSEGNNLVAKLVSEEQGIPHSVKFNADGTKLLVGYDKGAILWDLKEKAPVHTYLPRAHTGFDNPPAMEVTACDFSPDEDRVILAGGIQVCIYGTSSGEAIFSFKTPWIKSARYVANDRIATGHAGIANDVRVYDSSSGQLIQSLKCKGEILSLHYVSGNERLFIAAFHHNDPYSVDIYRWNLNESGGRDSLFTLKGHKDNVTAVRFMPSVGFILSSSYDRTTKFWDIESGRLLSSHNFRKVLATSESSIIVENFSPFHLTIK